MVNERDLDQAKSALHDLIIGNKAIKLQQNGRSVEYQPADTEKLKAYIVELETELGITTQRRRPAGLR